MFEKARIVDKDVLKKIEYLLEAKDTHMGLGKKLFEAYNHTIYPLDIFTLATINRSLNLLVPFCDLIKEKNIIAAAPLIRLQLDNVLRFYAAFIVDDPHDFAMKVINGKQVKHLKDKSGKKMSDCYLYEQLSKVEKKEWIRNVYKTTSGFIHLSERHIFTSFSAKDEEAGVITAKIALGEHDIDDKRFIEAIEAFTHITELLIKYIYGWIYTKDNPEICKGHST